MPEMHTKVSEIIDKYKVVAPGRKVVYTAIFGDYDLLKRPRVIDDDTEYFCFTDSPHLSSPVWNIVYCDIRYRCPVRTAKIFKLFPHLVFPNVNSSIWVDGCYIINESLSELFLLGKTNPLSFYPHPYCNCIYQEAFVIRLYRKESFSIIKKQIKRYKLAGFTKNFGIIHGAVIIRNHEDSSVHECMLYWWNEIEKHSKRDQLSFNYLVWKHSFPVNYLQSTLAKSDIFTYVPHENNHNSYFRNFLLKLLILYFRIRLRVCGS